MQRDTRSVVYIVMKIDPAEREKDLKLLRRTTFCLEETLQYDVRRISDGSLLDYFVAPLRHRSSTKALPRQRESTGNKAARFGL
jgi:hypothetical protein